jgi:V8-like Glu-specific endopeptidase
MTPPIEDKALAAFLLGVPAAMAGTTDDAVPDHRFIHYAEAFAPYTTRFRGIGDDGKINEATATLIGPHWAITAAHVAHEVKEITLTSGTTKRAVGRVVAHPEWNSVKHGWNDLALLHCDEPATLDYYPSLSEGGETEGQVVSIVGFGLHGKLSDGHSTYDGKLRAGTQTIERFERTVIVCHAKCGSSTLEFCIAPGDSGGPLFAGGKLAGVNSFTMASKGPLKSKAGEETAHTRVSLYRDWINQVMEDNR